jgi:hypothetical protein
LKKYENTKAGLVTVYADAGWDGSQAKIVCCGRLRDGLSFSRGVYIASIVGARFPLVAFAGAMIDELVEIIFE